MVRRIWAPALALVLIVAGLFLAVSAPWGFGWFAYAPLAELSFAPVVVPPQFVVGIALVIAGLALVSGWVGYRVGRREH